MNRALFLDRDGVIIEDRGYMRRIEEVCLVPGAAEALRAFRDDGWKLVIISNQSGVGRGLISPAEMDAVHARCLELLRAEGIEVLASYLCPHLPEENCHCRKPSPYHLLEAAREFGLDLRASWMIGDRESDIEAGHAAGCRAILLGGSGGPTKADLIFDHWNRIDPHGL